MERSGESLYNLVTDLTLFHNSKVHFVAALNNFLCGYNTLAYQLELLKFINYTVTCDESKIIKVAIEINLKIHKDLFVFHNHQLKAFFFSARKSKGMNAMQIASAINDSSSIKVFGIENCAITNDQIHHILTHNTAIEKFSLRSNVCSFSGLIMTLKALRNTSKMKCLDLGNNGITVETVDLILPALHANQIESLKVGNNNLGDKGAMKLAKALRASSSLRHLELECNNITEEGAACIIAVILSRNANLTGLKLNGNSLQSAGVITIAQGLENICTLRKLWLGCNNATKITANKIEVVLSHNTNLIELDLTENSLMSEGIIQIARGLRYVSTLQKLWLRNNKATEKAAGDIAAVLSHSTNLTELDLAGNNLKSEGIIRIAQGLQNVSTLQKLWLQNNQATEKAAGDIAAVLSHNPNLTELDLSENRLQTAGIIKIAQGLQNVSTLQKLWLAYNNITDKAADNIATVLAHNNNLIELDFNGNCLQAGGAIRIAHGLEKISTLQKLCLRHNDVSEEAADDLAAILSHCTNLTYLDLNGNNLKSEGVIKITKCLQKVSTLQKLCLGYNNVTEEAADDIAAILFHNTNLTYLDLNGNNFKSQGLIKLAKRLQYFGSYSFAEVHLRSSFNISTQTIKYVIRVVSCETNLKLFL